MPERPVVRIAFLDVGQGDTCIITIPETSEALIVDCVDYEAILLYLQNTGIKHLRGIVITHLHFDHFSGIAGLLDNLTDELQLKCERLLFHDPPITPNSLKQKLFNDDDHHSFGEDPQITKRKADDALRTLRKWVDVNPERCNLLGVQPGVNMPLPNVIELLHPQWYEVSALTSSNLNEASGIIKVTGSGSSALLMSDIQQKGWQSLRSKIGNLQCDVLKFPHHGSWDASTIDDLFQATDPSLVVISVGTSGHKQYDHPNQHVFDAIGDKAKTRVICTQVTEKCDSFPFAKKSLAVEKHENASSIGEHFFAKQSSGCPCASTIIVELGENATLLQPNPSLFASIIQNYSKPQCQRIKGK